MNTKRFLKSILTSSAMIAAASVPIHSANAAVIITAGNVALNAGANWNGGAAPATGKDSVQYGGAHDLNLNVADFDLSAGIDLNGVAPGDITLNESIKIGNIDLKGGTATVLNFNADKTLTLTGTVYTGLTKIDLNNQDGTINVSADDATVCEIDQTTTHNKGTLNISGDGNTIGRVGNTRRLETVNITSTDADKTTTFNNTVGAQVVNHTGGGKLAVTGLVTADKSVKTTGGAATFTGGVTVAGNGAAAADVVFETGDALTTFGAASTIGSAQGVLKIGAGGITTNNNLTLGAAGNDVAVSNTSGQLTFSTGATLTLNGHYSASGGVHLSDDTLVSQTLNVSGETARTISSAFTVAKNDVHVLKFQSGAAGVITQDADIGGADAVWSDVQIHGGDSSVNLAAGRKIYSTNVSLNNHADATLTLNAGSDVIGTIRTDADDRGALVIKGNSGSTSTKFAAGGNRLNTITFDKTADANSTFTTAAQSGTVKVGTVTFNAVAGDQSGIVFDMAGLKAGNNVILDVTGVEAANNGSTGQIVFKDSARTGATAEIVVGANHIGTAAKKVSVIDATGVNLTLTGGGNKIYANRIAANNLTLNNVNLGVYSRDGNSPTKYIVTGADSRIYTNSVISDATNIAEIYFDDAASRTITLEANVDHYGTVATKNNATGVLALEESNALNVSGIGASGRALESISLTKNGATTYTINSSGDIYSDVTKFTAATNATKLVLKGAGNVKGNINTNADDTGIVEFQQGISVDGSMHRTAAVADGFADVRINTTGTVTVGAATANSRYRSNATTFVQDGTLRFSDKVDAFANGVIGKVTTEGASGTGTLEINANYDNTGAAIGASDKKLKSVVIGSDRTLTTGADVYANNITTTENNKSAVVLGKAGNFEGVTVGTGANLRMRNVKVSANVTLDNIFSKEVTVDAGTALTAKTIDSTTAITGTGTINLLDKGAIITPANVASTAEASPVVAQGSATISGNLAGALTLNGGNAVHQVSFGGTNIAGNVTTDASTLNLTNTSGTVTFAGTLTTDGTTLNLGSNALNVTGVTQFGGATVIKLGDKTDAAMRSDAGGNTFELLAGGTLAFDFGGSATIDDSMMLFTKLDGTSAVAVTNLADDTDITVTNARTIKSVKYSTADNTFKVTRKNATELGTANLNANGNAKEVLKGIASATSYVGDEKAFVKALNSATTDKAVEELMTNFLPETMESVTSLNNASLNMVSNVSGARLIQAFAGDAIGAAAGDAADRFGLWADVKLGKAEQKERKSIAGYKSNSYGTFLGVDTMLNDKATLGVVFGYDNQRMKHQNAQEGSKTKASGLSFGAYGNYDFGNNFFAQGNASVTQTTVNGKIRKGTVGNYTIANGKYDVLGYAAEARGGYRFKFDNSTITPTAGLRYSYFGDVSYTETGAAYNLEHRGKASNTLAVVAGVGLGTALDLDGVDVKPEVHMNLAYDVVASKYKSTYNFVSGKMKFNYTGAKPARFAYNFGASVMARTDNIEYGVGYDADLGDKYIAHTGSMKVRVNF